VCDRPRPTLFRLTAITFGFGPPAYRELRTWEGGASMGTGPQGNGNQQDWMESFRKLRDASLDSWSRTMIELVNSDSYAQSSGVMLDAALTASAPFRDALETAMTHTLEQLSMPTRAEVASVAGRLTNIEMHLDDLDAKLDQLIRAQSKSQGGKPEPETPPAASAQTPQRRAAGHELSEEAHHGTAKVDAEARQRATQIAQDAAREAADKRHQPEPRAEHHKPMDSTRRTHPKGAK
jgi:hypothetical protein